MDRLRVLLSPSSSRDGLSHACTRLRETTPLSYQPALWLMVAGVAAPLLAAIPLGLKVPVVVLEVLLGILIGPRG